MQVASCESVASPGMGNSLGRCLDVDDLDSKRNGNSQHSMYYTPNRKGRAGQDEELDRSVHGVFGGCLRPRCTSEYEYTNGMDDMFTLLIDARCIGFEGKWKKSFHFKSDNDKNVEDLCGMLHRYFKLDIDQRILVQVYDEQFEEYVVRSSDISTRVPLFLTRFLFSIEP